MRKKTLVIFLFIGLLIAGMLGCTSQCIENKDFRDYRYNPFQFPYPVYYLKADRTSIGPDMISGDIETMEAFALRFDVEKKYVDDIKKRSQTVMVEKNNETRFIVMRSKESMMGCDAVVRELEKDYCSAFTSTREFHEKLFLLTPDSLSKERYRAAGNRWIVHRKGFILEHVEDIHIYDLKDFTVFRKDMKPSGPSQPLPVAIELVVFGHKDPDYYYTMAFREKDETLIMQILTTLRYGKY